MIFNEYDTIKTLVDKNNISKGTVGTIVLCHKSNDDYEIEFCNSDGETIAFDVYNSKEIKKVKGIVLNMISNYTDKAYLALYKIIDKYYDEDKNDWIASLASDMCPYTFVDSKSADPATYEDFTDCFNLCFAQSQKEDIETAYAASIKFLEMYRDEFGFDIDKYIKQLSFDMYKDKFEKD